MANKEFATHLEFKGVRRYFKDSRFEPVTKTSNMTSPVGLDSNGKLWTKEGEGGGGTSDHSQLSNRDATNQHPMSAITGLENEFALINDAFGDVFAGLGAKLSDAPSDGKQYARKDGVWAEVESGGTSDHTQLTNRNANNQHPMSAITGLVEALAAKGTYSKPAGGIPASDLAPGVIPTVITGLYDTSEGTVTLDFPTGTTDYFDYINGLLQQNNDVRIEVDAVWGDWTAVFRHSKTSAGRHYGGYHVFQNSELMDDGSTNAGFLWIDATSVTYVQDDRGGGGDSETYHGWYDGGSITLTDVPEGIDDYQDFFARLYFAGKNVILSIEEINGVWNTSFRLTKAGDGREGRFVLFSQLEEYNDSSDMILATIRIAEHNSIVYHAADLSDYAEKRDLGELSDLDTTDKSNIVAAINEVAASGGTSDHSQLSNRDAANQHPMSAITGLENEFGMVRDTFGDVISDLNNKLSDAPSDGKQYARRNGAWVEVQSGGGGGVDTVITGLYDTSEGTVTLDFPTGTTDYFDYINGLLQQNNDVRIEVDAVWGDWTAVFRHSKTSDDGQGRGYHVFQNSELMDDGSTNAGFLWIDATSVTYVQDDRDGADNLTEKLVKDNFDALKAYIDDQFKPHTIWEVEDAEDGITYSSGKSRQLSGSAWKLTGLNLLDNEGKRYVRLKFYFRGCVGTMQDQEGAGVVLEMSLDDRFKTPRSNLFCATSVGYAINDNGVKAGVVANISVSDGWNNAKCATTYTNFNTTGTTALERDYRLYRIEAYKN